MSIILGGYPKEMEQLLSMDPGLKSRFPNTLDFEDYNDVELLEIFCLMVTNEQLKLSEDIDKNIIKNKLSEIRVQEKEHFGNGRSVRNYFELVKENLDSRVMLSENIDINLIIKEDL